MVSLLGKRIVECHQWLTSGGKAPHWRTQKMLFDRGYLDFTPTGWAYGTSKMQAFIAQSTNKQES